MGIYNFNERIHILDSDVWSVFKEITDSKVQEEAFFVCDMKDIIRKHKLWITCFKRIQPFYAVKCNDSPIVLKVLAALGTSFDCCSQSEINKLLDLGVSPERIIFANPAKLPMHIRHAAKNGVFMMTFDNESELYKMKNLFPHAKLIIRIRCDATDALINLGNGKYNLGKKFGCDPVKEAPKLLQVARNLNLNVIGVSFHVGTGCQELSSFKRAIASARNIFDFASTLGYNFNLLDIGGGFPGDNLNAFKEFAQIINFSLDTHFSDISIRVIAEPGRFYVSSAFSLACKIHSVREMISETEKIQRMYYINDGVYGSFNCVLCEHRRVVPKPLHKQPPTRSYFLSSIWGPTCDSLDQVAEAVLLPEMQIGEWMIFENMGAYSLSVVTNFNGFPVSKVCLVADEDTWSLLKEVLPAQDFVMVDSLRLTCHA